MCWGDLGCCFDLKNIWNTPVPDFNHASFQHMEFKQNKQPIQKAWPTIHRRFICSHSMSFPDLSWPERCISDSLGSRLMRAGLCNWTWPWWPRSGLKNRWPLGNAVDKRRYTWKPHQTCLTFHAGFWSKVWRPPGRSQRHHQLHQQPNQKEISDGEILSCPFWSARWKSYK